MKWCNARSQMENKTPCYTIDGNIYKTGQITIPDCSFNANGYRLPTSGEWEYAARGGCFSRRFPWGDTISHDNANYKANGAAFSYDTSPYTTDTYHTSYDHGNLPYTSPVGSFAANDYGLYDMTGNVSEWCWGAGDDFDYNRLARGGCWYDLANDCRVGRSHMLGAGSWGVFLGFRTVISAE